MGDTVRGRGFFMPACVVEDYNYNLQDFSSRWIFERRLTKRMKYRRGAISLAVCFMKLYRNFTICLSEFRATWPKSYEKVAPLKLIARVLLNRRKRAGIMPFVFSPGRTDRIYFGSYVLSQANRENHVKILLWYLWHVRNQSLLWQERLFPRWLNYYYLSFALEQSS